MSDITPLFALDAEELMLAGKLDDAIELCKRGLEVYPDYAMAHYIIANSRFLAGEVEDAKGIVASALEIFPENITLQKLKETLDNHKEEVVVPEEVEEEVELAEEEPELGLEEWTSIDKNDYSFGDEDEETEPEETAKSEEPDEEILEYSIEETSAEEEITETDNSEEETIDSTEADEEIDVKDAPEEDSDDEEQNPEEEITETDDSEEENIDDTEAEEEIDVKDAPEEDSDDEEISNGQQMGDPREIEELMAEHTESEVQLFFGRIPLSSINPPDLAVILRALKGKDLKRRNKILNTDLFFDVLPKLDSVYEEEIESTELLGVDLDIDPDELDLDLEPDDLQAALELLETGNTEENPVSESEEVEVEVQSSDALEADATQEDDQTEDKAEDFGFSLVEEVPDDEFTQLANSIDSTKMKIENGYDEVETPEEESFEDQVVSDTMAEILTEQGEYKKAIEMYKTLLAENPEKQRDYLDKIAELEMMDMF
jgi:tetratricopeptide (TPR) repeat protein